MTALDDDDVRVLRNVDWAVTTEPDCWGYVPKPGQVIKYALYDASEDDPPIAVFDFKYDAELVCRALRSIVAEAVNR